MTATLPALAPIALPLAPPTLSDLDRARLSARIQAGWQQRALCRATGTNLWFPDDLAGELVTVRACYDCPVRTACLLTALVGDEAGVWGGTTETDRDRIRFALAFGVDR